MANNELYSSSGLGWLYCIAQNPSSNWGNIQSFYSDIENTETYVKNDDKLITVDSQVWGKIKNPEQRLPAKGDGLAFYHSSRALCNPAGSKIPKPRVSLIGQLIDIQYEGSDISILKVEVQLSVLKALKSRPIERDEGTRDIFEECGIVSGIPYSLYQANNGAWDKLISLVNKRI